MNLKSSEFINYSASSKVTGKYTINGPCFVYIKSVTNMAILKTYDGASLGDDVYLAAGNIFFAKSSIYIETWNNSGTSGFTAFVSYF